MIHAIVENKRRFLLFLWVITFKSVFANVSITEIMQSNYGGVLDYYNEFPDSWVEIYNSSDQEIDLKGYSISEVNDVSSSYSLPESLIVPAEGYTLIYCDKENKKQHTDFRLNTDKPGTVYLWDKNKVLVDSLPYPEMISPEVSWGRLPEHPDSLSHFRVATPASQNNNTNCERVLKKVDFSVDGGAKTVPFYLKLSLKGDYPKDAEIRYTVDGKEPTIYSLKYVDSIYIYKNTVVRAKPFSDSAISKISKTQTYFFDIEDKMPIINIVCDPNYLYDKNIGILSSSTKYADTHDDNLPRRSWMGLANYYYDWRRPINIEYYSGDSSTAVFNQLSEARVSGNVSRQYAHVKSMVVYANKRFGEKHFNGVFWKHLRPNANKQKSMTIRTSTDDTYSLNDMLSQTAIARFAKYYDVDFQAQRNVQYCINGEFQQIMHLQERDGADMVWANHNKVTDIECIETSDGLYDGFYSPDQFPNYDAFKRTFQSRNCTYQQMDEVLDINAFMNYVSTNAYFANVDFPYNNVSLWYDKQGSKKWRWIMKDMDATIQDPAYPYYNFLLRVEPCDKFDWANSPAACEVYIKMFSFEKFKQPYIDRTCVLAGTAFSKNTLEYMLDSIVGDMSLALSSTDLKYYIRDLESFYAWCNGRPQYYSYHLSDFFGLGDTTQLTINGLYNDSIIYFNNNPLMENKYEGHFFEDRDMYLTHNNKLDIYGLDNSTTNEIDYLDLGKMIETQDSAATKWTISYWMDDERIFKHYANENVHFKIPEGAKDVKIVDGYAGNMSLTSVPSISSRAPEDLTYMVYSVNGVFIGKFNYAEFSDFKQKDDINIVVIYDSTGKKLYTIKLLKK